MHMHACCLSRPCSTVATRFLAFNTRLPCDTVRYNSCARQTPCLKPPSVLEHVQQTAAKPIAGCAHCSAGWRHVPITGCGGSSRGRQYPVTKWSQQIKKRHQLVRAQGMKTSPTCHISSTCRTANTTFIAVGVAETEKYARECTETSNLTFRQSLHTQALTADKQHTGHPLKAIHARGNVPFRKGKAKQQQFEEQCAVSIKRIQAPASPKCCTGMRTTYGWQLYYAATSTRQHAASMCGY